MEDHQIDMEARQLEFFEQQKKFFNDFPQPFSTATISIIVLGLDCHMFLAFHALALYKFVSFPSLLMVFQLNFIIEYSTLFIWYLKMFFA